MGAAVPELNDWMNKGTPGGYLPAVPGVDKLSTPNQAGAPMDPAVAYAEGVLATAAAVDQTVNA